jgi:hypothetical protein
MKDRMKLSLLSKLMVFPEFHLLPPAPMCEGSSLPWALCWVKATKWGDIHKMWAQTWLRIVLGPLFWECLNPSRALPYTKTPSLSSSSSQTYFLLHRRHKLIEEAISKFDGIKDLNPSFPTLGPLKPHPVALPYN